MGTVIGQIIDAEQVEAAVTDMLKLRLPTYLDEVAQQRGRPRGTYQKPRSWVVVNEFDKWPEDKLPCVLVISPGMVDRPRKRGNGEYDGSWYIATAVVVETRTRKSTLTVAKRYGAALRTCMLENAGLEGAIDGKAEVIDWISEDYDDISEDDSRNLYAAKNIFTVEVKGITNAYRGPSEWQPDEDGHTPDYGDLPTADPEKLQVDVTQIVD